MTSSAAYRGCWGLARSIARAGLPFGFADTVCAAHVEVLRADALLAEWTGGRQFRGHFARPIGSTWPHSVSLVSTMESPPAVGGQEGLVNILTGYFFKEEHRKLADDERSVGAVLDQHVKALAANGLLQLPDWGGVPLVDRSFGSEAFALNDPRFEGNEVEMWLGVLTKYELGHEQWATQPARIPSP